MVQKNIPFSFVVDDMPTYKLLVQLKAENPILSQGIIPILGVFHQQMSYMYASLKVRAWMTFLWQVLLLQEDL